MAFLDIKDKLEFEPPPPAPPTTEQLRAEHDRRLEATANIGPLSARANPRKTENPLDDSINLKEFVQKAINNLDREARGETPVREKPAVKKFRQIPMGISSDDLRSGNYSASEIRDFLARRNKTPEKKQ
jgi:hypothetical protein